MTDLAELRARIAANAKNGIHVAPVVPDLIAEVERLRGVNADLRLMVDGLETAAHEERAAVVAFVRGARLEELADAIERGEHRREEER